MLFRKGATSEAAGLKVRLTGLLSTCDARDSIPGSPGTLFRKGIEAAFMLIIRSAFRNNDAISDNQSAGGEAEPWIARVLMGKNPWNWSLARTRP